MTKQAMRRRTDMKSDRRRLAELTAAEKQMVFQMRLSREVARACDSFLRGRGIPPGTLAGEYPGRGAIAPPEASSTQPEATRERPPGGWVESPAAHAPTPRPQLFRHVD